MRHVALLGIGLIALLTGEGRAAEPDLRDQIRQRSARNELGVLMYCRDQGLADPAAVLAQQRRVAALPPVPAGVGEQEEADGRSGYLAFEGRQGLFAASASAQGLSVATACAVRASLVEAN